MNNPDNERLYEDDSITSKDLLSLLLLEILHKGQSKHNLDSMNEFFNYGINQIITNTFTITGKVINERDKDPEDREIKEILYEVSFTDAKVEPPRYTDIKSKRAMLLNPAQSRLSNIDYFSNVYIDIVVKATAIYHNKTEREIITEIKDVLAASVPCMTGTELCATYQQPWEILKRLGEDPHSYEGVFIIKGNEWIVDSIENMIMNRFRVNKTMYDKDISVGRILSRHGIHFETSFEVIIRFTKKGAILVQFNIGQNKTSPLIPFYLLYYAMGWSSDYEIIKSILFDPNDSSEISRQLLMILDRAFDDKPKTFKDPRSEYKESQRAILAITRVIMAADNETLDDKMKDDDLIKYYIKQFLHNFNIRFMPHMGITSESINNKLKYFGLCIRETLLVSLGAIPEAQRDRLGTKRILAAGQTLSRTFKTIFNYVIIMSLKKALTTSFKKASFSNVNIKEVVLSAIKPGEVKTFLAKCIKSGQDKIKVKRDAIPNRVSGQQLARKNDANVLSAQNTINIASQSATKQTDRAEDLRKVHASFPGYVDTSQAPESSKIGTVKQMDCTTMITLATSEMAIESFLIESGDVNILSSVQLEHVISQRLTIVSVNGKWIGCSALSTNDLARKYRELRRNGVINRNITIFTKPDMREIIFSTDSGRLTAPYIIVYNNLDKYIEADRAPKNTSNPIKFEQWTRLTPTIITQIRTGILSFDDLIEKGIIELIDSEEAENDYVAHDFDVFKANRNNIKNQYAHVFMPQQMLGLVTLSCPFGNYSNTVRNTYFTNHRRQACSWFALNYPYIMTKKNSLMYYLEKPLVPTITDSVLLPCGQNLIIAVAQFTGLGQEDSTIVNKSSIECGIFNSCHFDYEQTEKQPNEQFGNVDFRRTISKHNRANYDKCDERGFAKVGTKIEKNDVLIIKTQTVINPNNKEISYIDKSIKYKEKTPAYIDKVVAPTDLDDTVAKVRYIQPRHGCPGNKIASRTGNKGIISHVMGRQDILMTESGMPVDAIININSIPTRMAVNQLREAVVALLGALEGVLYDGTAFCNIDIEEIMTKLKAKGVEYNGYQRVFNGLTGDYLDSFVFVAPMYYQYLKKFVADQNYAVRVGPINEKTHQPLKGKSSDGGLRAGEMEIWTKAAHGTMRALYDKIYIDSDGLEELYICRTCGKRAVANPDRNIYICYNCDDSGDIVKTNSSWVANMLFHEASAMNVNLQFTMQNNMEHQYD